MRSQFCLLSSLKCRVVSRVSPHILRTCFTFRFASHALPASHSYTLFRTMGLRHLPIVDECNCIVGMITRADLLKPIELSPQAPSVTPLHLSFQRLNHQLVTPCCRVTRKKRLTTHAATGTTGCRCLCL